MNQYRCIVVECCGKCIHSAYRSPTERFCNRKKPYWTLRLDQWADGISSCCSLPTHSDFQSDRDTVLERLHIWFENYCEGNEDPDLWMAFLHAERTLRQAGELDA
jgi:hypothetical protein